MLRNITITSSDEYIAVLIQKTKQGTKEEMHMIQRIWICNTG